MIELTYGPLPTYSTWSRIYRVGFAGELGYRIWSDGDNDGSEDEIAGRPNFRGWVTERIPYEGSHARLRAHETIGFTPSETEVERLRYLKENMLRLRVETERAAYAYFAACPVGAERIWASHVLDNIRNATRDA